MTLHELYLRAHLAFGLGYVDYAIAVCQRIVQQFPSHLKARLLLGQALIEQRRMNEAGQHFDAVLRLDPEHAQARAGLAVVLERQGQLKAAINQLDRAWQARPDHTELRDGLLSLRAQLERTTVSLDLNPAVKGRVYGLRGQHQKAVAELDKALTSQPDRVDLQLAHAESLWRTGRWQEAEQSCQRVTERAPEAVKARALLALIALQHGDEARGVRLLHEASALDPSWAVLRRLLEEQDLAFPDPGRLWELDHPDMPVPEEVASAVVGLDSIPEEHGVGDLPLVEEEPEPKGISGSVVDEFQVALQEVAERLSVRPRLQKVASTALGSYVLVSNRHRLIQKYGRSGFQAIEVRLQALAEAISANGYAAQVIYADERASLQSLAATADLHPASDAPEALRGLLSEAIQRSKQSDERIAHVLLIGGEDIISFHRLPNPAEDEDPLILTDAPYTGDGPMFYENARSVGRIPDGAADEPAYLLNVLNRMIERYYAQAQRLTRSAGLTVPAFMHRNVGPQPFGYAALVWKAAAHTIWQEFGEGGPLMVCPPTTARSIPDGALKGRPFYLFNLHGTEQGGAWYGQKDASYPADSPLFPVALTPQAVSEVDVEGAIVFTEACYGGHVFNKTSSESLALQFLRQGAACVVGATVISYGAADAPLTGADLLAQLFWSNLRSGRTAGEALAQAKAAYVTQVEARQGYLEGDDQKTLLSFVLLGDPAARLRPTALHSKAAGLQVAEPPCPPVSCRAGAHALAETRPGGEFLIQVRRHLQRVAPETADSQLDVVPRQVHGPNEWWRCEGT